MTYLKKENITFNASSKPIMSSNFILKVISVFNEHSI